MVEISKVQEPITDSPWFWVYLFATAALILLTLFRPKLELRQQGIDRKNFARQQVAQSDTSDWETAEPAKAFTLVPLYIVLGFVVCLGWGQLWYSRYRSSTISTNSASESLPETESD